MALIQYCTPLIISLFYFSNVNLDVLKKKEERKVIGLKKGLLQRAFLATNNQLIFHSTMRCPLSTLSSLHLSEALDGVFWIFSSQYPVISHYPVSCWVGHVQNSAGSDWLFLCMWVTVTIKRHLFYSRFWCSQIFENNWLATSTAVFFQLYNEPWSHSQINVLI